MARLVPSFAVAGCNLTDSLEAVGIAGVADSNLGDDADCSSDKDKYNNLEERSHR